MLTAFYPLYPLLPLETKSCKPYTISVQLYTKLRQNVFDKMDLQHTMTSSAFPCPFCPIKGYCDFVTKPERKRARERERER